MRADFELKPLEQVVERNLINHYAAGDPSPAFVGRLERQLLGQIEAKTPSRQAARRWRWPLIPRSTGWAAAAAGLLLVAALAVTVIGPERVWAEVQRLLGYVPGIGFVDLEDARVLAAPVQVEREGVTLRVDQVIAEAGRTRVVVSSDGLPAEDAFTGVAPRPDEREAAPAARLRLPDGSLLTAGKYALRWGTATLEFPALPAGLYTATLELDRLPLVPPRIAPENWAVALALQPATGPLVSELFAAPYQPAGASDTQAGITISVVEVANSPEATVLKVFWAWDDPSWQVWSASDGITLPVLRDDVGHVYWEKPSAGSGSAVVQEVIGIEATSIPSPPPSSLEGELAFAPVSALASKLTLEIDSVGVTMPADAGFEVTLPPGAEVGDRWPLDIRLQVVGFPLHITGARLTEQVVGQGEGAAGRLALEFEIDGVTEQGERTLTAMCGRPTGSQLAFGCASSYDYAGRKLNFSLTLSADTPLPSGAIQVRIDSAHVMVRGPWRAGWAVPGRQAAGSAPVTRRPAGVTDTHHGITLGLLEATSTDRLVAVKVDLQESTADSQLYQLVTHDAAPGTMDLYLEDDRGVRHGYVQPFTAWQPDGMSVFPGAWSKPGAQQLTLQPLPALARRATLSFPAITILRPGQASFEVTAPADARLVQKAGHPPMSEPWPVDIAFSIGPYSVRFAEAQLIALDGGVYLMLLPDTQRATGEGRALYGLCGVQVTGPSGASVPVSHVWGEGACTTAPGFDVLDLRTGSVLSGTYHVEIDGFTETVPGPWRLTWQLTGS